MFASLSIFGLYEYNTDVFANLTLPDGMTGDILIPKILSECSDFALIYPNYDFMKMMIGVWSKNEGHIWKRLYESELIEFNPIENYDRHESLTRAVTSNSKGVSKGNTSTVQTDNTEEQSETTASPTATATENRSTVRRRMTPTLSKTHQRPVLKTPGTLRTSPANAATPTPQARELATGTTAPRTKAQEMKS